MGTPRHGPPNPIVEARRIGTVTASSPQRATINLPNAAAAMAIQLHGEAVPRGEVGEYVCFPRPDRIVLGCITSVELPERDRLRVEPVLGTPPKPDPIGHVSLLTDVKLPSGDVTGAVTAPPRLGTAAYSAPTSFLRWVLEFDARLGGAQEAVALYLGDVPGLTNAPVTLTPERLFGRHCAILGVTGGGKSWSIARLIEQCARLKSKIVLLDATGEFATLGGGAVSHLSIGASTDAPADSADVSCPYFKMEERDLFALFTPSGQSQVPVLRAAIRSLKLARCASPADFIEGGCIPKEWRFRAPFEEACKVHAAVLESSAADFDISLLAAQIVHECVNPYGGQGKWGSKDDKALSWCLSLLVRIEGALKSPAMESILSPGTRTPMQDRIAQFLEDPTKTVLRISMKYLSFLHNARALVANVVGRYLMDLARSGRFREKPAVVFLDEAHQFLGKEVGEDEHVYELDAFEVIAKEGRKYGLTVAIATQRPRDIHDGVLSQMGTMIVHRLAHSADRDVVERAARDTEKSVAALLPTLAQGQALLIGADFPVPIPIQVRPPEHKPDSRGPDYQKYWAPASSS